MNSTRVSTTQSEQNSKGAPRKQLERLNKGSLILFTLMFVSACTMFFTHLGDLPIFSPDEALYAEPAREMLETGEYITTYNNYEVRYTKPPLFIWAIAASMKLFEVTEFASRFFSACCGAILVGITYLFTEKFFRKKAAVIAALTLILAPMYMAVSRLAITDIPLALFITGALMSLFYGFSTGESRWKWIAYVLLGLGVMTKGPVAIVLPAIVLFAYHLLTGEIKKAWSYYRPFAGLGVIALIAVPWFALEIWITKGEYWDAFIMRENLQRFTGVVDHKYPWFYHIIAMFGGFFPWSFVLPFAWASVFLVPYNGTKKWLVELRESGLAFKAALFSTVSALTILVFFSASVSKLLPYTLPAFPFLACIAGYYIMKLVEARKWIPVCAGFALFAVAAMVSRFTLPPLIAKIRDCPPELITFTQDSVLILIGVGLIPLALAASKRLYASVITFAVLLMSTIIYFGPTVQNILSEHWEMPLKTFAQYAKDSDRTIYLCNLRKPSATFYALRRVEKEETLDGLWKRLENDDTAYVIGRLRHLEDYLKNPNCKLISKKGKFVLISWDTRKSINTKQELESGN